ncbi:MAG: GIY-YIG nuclease family protein [Candidatus Limiplasma sp.]|nr:GIY-YIG nuclease family protein [Candidatus Limiplasma sp.]
MESAQRRNLKNAYKEQAAVGGVFCIECSGNRRRWLKASPNIAGMRHKFEFAMAIGSCPEPGMRAEWLQYGAASFTFTVLETLTKKETQTDAEFGEDLGVLLELWTEKTQADATV